MNALSPALAAAALVALSTLSVASDPVFRKPFTLTLQVDKEHYYEERFKAIPYTFERDIYLFKGERFGVRLNPGGAPDYEPDLQKADIEFKFEQDVMDDGKGMMLLTIANRTSKVVEFEALMTIPGSKNILKTSILPLEPGLSSYESWPHPIIQLLLRPTVKPDP